MGGAIGAIDYMKSRLVDSNAERLNRIEAGETVVVGVNKFQKGEQSPLMTGDGGIMVVDPAVSRSKSAALKIGAPPAMQRLSKKLSRICATLQPAEPTLCPHPSLRPKPASHGEWAAQMRVVHGEYRGPTGVSGSPSNKTEGLDEIRDAVDAVSDKLGRRLKFVMENRDLTATPTAQSKLPSVPAIVAWISLTKESA